MSKSQIIVYVDDDYDDLLFLQEAFRDIQDYQLVCLLNGDELFALLESGKYNVCLIILDINMPIRSGIDILLDLKTTSNYNFIPVVMLSTSKSPKENAIVQGLGCEIVLKPNTYTGARTLAAKLLEYC